jgi:hypothetical protein
MLVPAGILLSRMGVLSASFIPVYAKLLAEEDEELAGRKRLRR